MIHLAVHNVIVLEPSSLGGPGGLSRRRIPISVPVLRVLTPEIRDTKAKGPTDPRTQIAELLPLLPWQQQQERIGREPSPLARPPRGASDIRGACVRARGTRQYAQDDHNDFNAS